MPPSARPGGRQQPSSFGSVDWLSQSSCSGPGQVPGFGEIPQTFTTQAKLSELTVREKPAAGLSKEPGAARVPRVRTAFTSEQVSALEGTFQQSQYLGPLVRRKLAQETRLSEVQIKTWFQNRRMKHKRQLQDSQLNVPLSQALRTPLALSPAPAPGRGLQLPYAWAPLPRPQAPVLPAGSFWGLCQVKQGPMASVWASCRGQPVRCHLTDSGNQVHTLGPALSGGPWGHCTLPETEGAF